eukprot:831875-Pyramimonas_sp.AAC.1
MAGRQSTLGLDPTLDPLLTPSCQGVADSANYRGAIPHHGGVGGGRNVRVGAKRLCGGDAPC